VGQHLLRLAAEQERPDTFSSVGGHLDEVTALLPGHPDDGVARIIVSLMDDVTPGIPFPSFRAPPDIGLSCTCLFAGAMTNGAAICERLKKESTEKKIYVN